MSAWPPAEPDRVGQLIADKYRIVRLLGAGGMGSVYEAKHTFLGRRVALKFLHPNLALNAEMVARFQSEAKAAGGLESENLVAVTDFGTTADGACFLVMEYLDGEDLAHLLERVGPLSVVRAVRLVMQACRGVGVAHRADIVHRDLKPQNLFVLQRGDGSDLVKVLDFGIAKLRRAAEKADFSTMTGAAMGTPNYMAPEQARSAADVDQRADVYALGVILYEALSANVPHPGESYNQIIVHVLTQPPIRLDSVRGGLPSRLHEIVHRAIATEPSARFSSVESLATALQPYANAWAPEHSLGATVAQPMSAGATRVASSQGGMADDTQSPLSLSQPRPTDDGVSPIETRSGVRTGDRTRVALLITFALVVAMAALLGFGVRGIFTAARAPAASAPAPYAPAASGIATPATPERPVAGEGTKEEHPPIVVSASPTAVVAPAKPRAAKPARVEPSASAGAPLPKPETGWRSVLVRDIAFDAGSKTSGQRGSAGDPP